MPALAGPLGAALKELLGNLFSKFGPILESFLADLLLQALAESSPKRMGQLVGDTLASSTGSQISPFQRKWILGVMKRADWGKFLDHVAASTAPDGTLGDALTD